MSTPYHSTSLLEHQHLGVSTQPSPIEQPLSPPVSEGEPSRPNGRKTNHVGRSCVSCRDMRQKCGPERPCKRCVARGEDCLDSANPDLRRRPTASQLKEARNRITDLEAIVQMMIQREQELQTKLCRQAQLLRVHGYAQPLPQGHPPQDPTGQPAKPSLSISTNHDLGEYCAPSAVPSIGTPSPAESSPTFQGWCARDDDAVSNLSYGYDESVNSFGEGSSGVSRLEPPPSEVSMASGSVNSMDDGILLRSVQYQHQRFLELPRVGHHGRSRSETGLGPKQMRPYHHRALGGPHVVNALMSTDVDMLNAYHSMRGSHNNQPNIIPLVPEFVVPVIALNHDEPHPAADSSSTTYATSPSANSPLPAFNMSTFQENSWLSGASYTYGGAGATNSHMAAEQPVPAHIPTPMDASNNYPHAYLWSGLQQPSYGNVAMSAQDSRMHSAYGQSPMPQSESHPHQSICQHFDHSVPDPFSSGNVTPYDFNAGPPHVHVTPSSPRASHPQTYANPH